MTGYIRKRKTSSGVSYQVVLETSNASSGRRKRIYKTFSNKPEAEAFKTKSIADYNTGRFLEPNKITVEELCLEWMKGHFILIKESTQRGYRVNIEIHIIPHIGDIEVQKLSASHIQTMVNSMHEKGLAPRSIKYVITNLNQILNYAISNDIIIKNPTRSVILPRQEKFQHEVYSLDEVKKLIHCSKGTKLEEIIAIEVFTGLRRGEVLALKWEDINFEEKTLTIRRNLIHEDNGIQFTTPKTQAGTRTIVVPNELIIYLERLKNKRIRQRLRAGRNYNNLDLIVCKENGEPYDPRMVSIWFREFLDSNNLKRIRFHDLRHTHATLLLVEYGTSIKAISDRLGHSKVQTTMDYYISSTDSAQQEAIGKLEKDLMRLGALTG